MVDADADPAGILADVVDAVRHGAAELFDEEVVHPHRLGRTLGSPFAAGVLEVADQFLLLGIDRDRRLAPRQRLLHLRVDVVELGIAIGMTCPFARLAVGLQAVVERPQQCGDRVVADAMAECPQPVGKLAQALGRPQQRRLRIAARHRLNQLAQVLEQAWVRDRERLAAATWPANTPSFWHNCAAQIGQASSNRAARNPGDARHRAHSAVPGRLRLGRRQTPSALLVKHRFQRLVAQPNRRFIDHAAALHTPIHGGNPPSIVSRFNYS